MNLPQIAEAYLPSRLGLSARHRADVHIAQALDQALAQAQADVALELEQLGRSGYESAAQAVLDALPAEWLPVFAALAAARRRLAPVQEAETPQPQPRPSGKRPQAPWEIQYQWAPVEQGALKGKEAQQFIQALLFPPPTKQEVQRWLTEKPPGGLSWAERLRRWEQKTRGAMLTQLTQGLVAGENIDGLRARLEPFTAGLAYRAQRIARTEGCRVAERAGRACYSRMGDMLDGLQIVAVMDEWTRPHHAARNGRIWRRGPDGLYRDEAGQLLPDLPDEPNCRCMTIPVLQTPEVFRDNPAALETFLTAAKELVPDPASYADWWRKASERERQLAVGVKRYQAMRDMLANGPTPRAPEWEDFITPQGKLIPVENLRAESPEERSRRLAKVQAVLASRRQAYQAVASTGLPPGQLPPGGRPPTGGGANIPPSGDRPDKELLQQLDLGPPKQVEIVYSQKGLVQDIAKNLFRRRLTEEELARLAGALDEMDVLVKIEEEGLRLEAIRPGVRFHRWVGHDERGRLKLHFHRADVAENNQGLGTRSVVRSVHQAALLGVQYAEATALRSATEGGYYYLARCGFDAPLPKLWLETFRKELKELGLQPRRLSHLMETLEGRAFWKLHGITLNVKMDLSPGSEDIWRLAGYLQERKQEGRPMAEDKTPSRPPVPEDKLPRYCSLLDIEFTDEDEAILDRVWAEIPVTEEEDRKKDEFFATWKPFSRGKGFLSPELYAKLEEAKKRGVDFNQITERVYLP